MLLQIIIGLVIGLAGGFGVGWVYRQKSMARKVGTAEQKASKILEDAKAKEKEILLEAKTKAIQVTDEAKKSEAEFRKSIAKFQESIDRREKDLDVRRDQVEKQKSQLEAKGEELKGLQEELKVVKQKQIETLERVAAMSREEAKTVLLENAERGMKDELVDLQKKLLYTAREEADKQARVIIANAMERCVADVTAETTTTAVEIPNEEIKGRIIGKEGRNIRAFEQMLGCEILIDDSPDTVVISGFNSVRRYIAKLTLEKLVADGRIHPARIEEAYEKSKAEVNEEIKRAGEEACYELGITNFPPKLVHLVGRLIFRTSYGQNVLKHSIEMAKIGAVIAAELGADVSIVKQGALLHDVGKALDQELEGTHVEIGVKIAEKFNMDPRVVEAIESHHHDTDVSEKSAANKHKKEYCVEAKIVDYCDGISGGRPGARKDSFENYVKRLTDLENIATSKEGVQKAYAIQGGRELRVFVVPENLDDWGCAKLAREVANQIEAEMKYPGEIRVQVIRETRVIEYAR